MFFPKDRVYSENKNNGFGCLFLSAPFPGGSRAVIVKYQGYWITPMFFNNKADDIPFIGYQPENGEQYTIYRDLPGYEQKVLTLIPGEGWTVYGNSSQTLYFRPTPIRVLETNEFIWLSCFRGFSPAFYGVHTAKSMIEFCKKQISFCCTVGQNHCLQALIVEALIREEKNEETFVVPEDRIHPYFAEFSEC